MEGNKFKYSYTAPSKDERREIEEIKRRYGVENREKGKMARLRDLDKKVKNPPTVVGLTLGIIGTLVFGLGLTFVLEWANLLLGILLMLVGCIPVAAAYPAYNITLGRGKKKYGDEILRLSEELLGGELKDEKDGE